MLGAGALLAGPTVLAFGTGGYFEGPRLIAGVIAAGLALLAALLAARPLPRSPSGRLTIAAMALFVAWSGASIAWAPVTQDAYGDLERLLLYLAVLVAGAAFFRGRLALAAVEPMLAAGCTVVMTYGLSERLVPGLLHFQQAFAQGGRLEQPLTYWNAMGALGALGLVLCARLAGDASRATWMRTAAVACAAPLGAGFYLTFSRGAYAALIAGGLLLVVLSPTRSQVRGAALVIASAAVPIVGAASLDSVQTLQGSLAHREAQGAIELALVVVSAVVFAVAAAVIARRERDRRLRTSAIRLPSRKLVGAAVPLILVGLIALGGIVHERHHVRYFRAPTSGSSRLVSLTNDRYEYWDVAVGTFGRHPLVGVGAAGFREEWLAHRTVPEIAKDAHSLYIETAAELGLVGLALLAALVAGSAATASAALRVYPVRAPGMVAGLAAFAVHAGLDWDWEFPAVSLIAILLLAALIAAGDSATAPAPVALGAQRRRLGSGLRARRRALA